MTRFHRLSAAVVWLAAFFGTAALLAEEKRQVPVDSLIFDLKNPDPVRRKDAVTLLGTNRVQKAVPDLVAAAKDSDPSVRREVLIALDHIADPRSIPAFVQLTADSEKDIRERAIGSLVRMYVPPESGITAGLTRVANFVNPWSDEWAEVVVEPGIGVDPTVSPALRERLRDSDEGIRVKAARTLGILRARDAQPALVQSLKEDKSNTVRFESIRAVRKIGDASAAGEVLGYASFSDSRVRNEAVLTVGRFHHREAVPELTRLFEAESALPAKRIDRLYRERLLDALAFIADPASKDLFVKELRNPDDLVRLRAVEGTARLADSALVTEVSRDRLREKDVRVRAAQAYALYRMGRKEYLDEVTAALGDRKSRNEAKQYLVELSKEELPDLYAQIRNKEVAVREGLAEVIGIAGDNRGIPALQELARDGRGNIGRAANQALRRLNTRLQ